MWDYLAPVTAIVLAIVLAAWGIFPGFRRPCATVVVAIVVLANIGASIFSVRSMHAANEDIIGSMTGGDSYSFITPMFSGSPQDQNKIIILGLENAGNYTLYELRVSITDQLDGQMTTGHLLTTQLTVK